MTRNGTITSVSGNSLGITDAQGNPHSYTLDGQSKVTVDGQPAAPSALVTGQTVSVVSDGDKVKQVNALTAKS